LVEAVREYLEDRGLEDRGLEDRGFEDRGRGDRGRGDSAPGARFTVRVAGNVLAMVQRELQWGAAFSEAHHRRLEALGFDDDRALAAAIRSGACDGQWSAVGEALAASARDQLLVANPSYLPTTG